LTTERIVQRTEGEIESERERERNSELKGLDEMIIFQPLLLRPSLTWCILIMYSVQVSYVCMYYIFCRYMHILWSFTNSL